MCFLVKYASLPNASFRWKLKLSSSNHAVANVQLTSPNLYIFLSDDAQTALATAQEKERAATEHALEANTRITSLGSQLATYRQEKSRLEALLEMERARFEAAEEGKSRYMWAAEWVEEAFITAPRKLGQTQKQSTPLERANQN